MRQDVNYISGKVKNRIEQIIPVRAWVPLTIEVLLNFAVYWGAMEITAGRHHYIMEMPLDGKIPLICQSTAIYFGCYLFWIANYILIVRQSKEEMYRFLSADFLAKIVCLVFFLVLPTTNVRPEITGDGFWEQTMRFLYGVDEASNLFPSIHCLTSWFCYIGIRKKKCVPAAYRAFSCMTAIAVCISTLTTKQHVLVDVPAGILLAEVCYRCAKPCGFAAVYEQTAERITGWLFKLNKKEY